MAVETCVPLMSASPSLGPRASGSSSSRCSASAAGMISPWSAIRPCPNMTAERWARGARSPDAPTEPCAATHGMASHYSMSSRRTTTLHLTPDLPHARQIPLLAITTLLTGRETPLHTPQLFNRMRLVLGYYIPSVGLWVG